jgi:hypothetical protein
MNVVLRHKAHLTANRMTSSARVYQDRRGTWARNRRSGGLGVGQEILQVAVQKESGRRRTGGLAKLITHQQTCRTHNCKLSFQLQHWV